MSIRAKLAHRVRVLTQPLSPSQVVDREAGCARFIFAALIIVVSTAGLLGPTAVNWSLFGVAVLTVGLTGIASLLPACRSTLNHIGGLLIAAEIATLIAATGGSDSPYEVFYGMLLIYATMFYGSRRLTATAVVLLALFVVPHLVSDHAAGHWTRVVATVAVWAVIGSVTHRCNNYVRRPAP